MNIKKLTDLRKINMYQLANALREHNCDPDVAALAAWYVYHGDRQAKNWGKHLNLCYHYMQSQYKRHILSKKVADIVMEHYKETKINNRNCKLLPS